ncbi:MAG TPA: SAM-dependent methyltransferase [bacterium]|nr:SAM-dependent methyltransferase [bacterium]
MKKLDLDIHNIEILEFSKKKKLPISEYFEPVYRGESIGYMSEAGSPGIADPGEELARYAHRAGIIVKPLTGPSSILLALIASGLNGQNFTFHGYLPISKEKRRRSIMSIERESRNNNSTQIFIETPYRSDHLFNDLISTASKSTLLTVASDITSQEESILTLPIYLWKKRKDGVNLQNKQTVFLLLARK